MKTFIFLPFWVVLGYAQPITTAGLITGNLTGDDGTAIAGAIVTLHRMPPYPSAKVPQQVERSEKSSSEGSFQFNAPGYGSYRLCAQAPGTVWLNPCEWGLRPPTISLTVVQKSAQIALVMKKGTAVPIRIDDPNHLLSANEGKVAAAHLLVGISNDALVFVPASPTSTDSSGRNLQIVIPYDTTVKLVVGSAFFKLADAAARPLASTVPTMIPVIIPTGQQVTPIRFSVTGTTN